MPSRSIVEQLLRRLRLGADIEAGIEYFPACGVWVSPEVVRLPAYPAPAGVLDAFQLVARNRLRCAPGVGLDETAAIRVRADRKGRSRQV
jgi:hypothetical protein